MTSAPTPSQPKPTPAPSNSATQAPSPAAPVFKLGLPTFFGSGCPADSLQVVPSPDGQTMSILFSEFAAQTTPLVNRDRRACNLAVPVTLQSGISIGVYRVDYRGYSYVPRVTGAYTDLQVSYFFAGATGPTFKRLWSPGSDEPVEITNKVGVSGIVWTPCDKVATTFRVNAAITAFKSVADANEQVQIEIDTTDVTVEDAMRFFLTTPVFWCDSKCTAESGLQLLPPQLPTADQVPKLCSSSACKSLLVELKKAAPKECTIAISTPPLELYAQLLTPLEKVSETPVATPVTPTAGPTAAPTTTVTPVATTATPGATTQTPLRTPAPIATPATTEPQC